MVNIVKNEIPILLEVSLIRINLSKVGGTSISSGVIKYVDIRRTINGESKYLDFY